MICAVLQYKVRSWEYGKQLKQPSAPLCRLTHEGLTQLDVFALSASLGALLDGERGWITLSEARDLFSTMDDQYAFGEMDEIGRANLVAFAAQSEHRSTFDLMPVEGASLPYSKINLTPTAVGTRWP